MKTVFIDWNLIPYAEAWQRQTEWFDNIVWAKVQGESYENRIVMCEHPHVYTLGRSGKENNMLLSDEQLKAIDATLIILIGEGILLIMVRDNWCAIRY